MDAMGWLMGPWSARAGAARPRRPRARARRAPLSRHRWRDTAGSVGARAALERGPQARGRPAAHARRVRRAALPRARHADRQAGAVAPEGRGGARGRPEGFGALPRTEADQADGQLAAAMQRIGELSMEVELLRARIARPGPLARRRSRRWPRRPPRPPAIATVSRASAASGRSPDPRSVRHARSRLTAPSPPRARRAVGRSLPSPTRTCRRPFGPTSLARPGPARGIARCGPDCGRWMDGIRVSRKRVLRLMREHALLSPHRSQPRPAAAHERQIITAAPNVMWAIDATQVTTVEDGKVWLFGVVEHWNAEMLGWHVAKHGTRYEAIQALGMAVRQRFGGLDAGAARGRALRHDHGSNFMADVFQKQIGFWGVAPSYAFVAEPETNGCLERLFRTLKEQIVHGRIFQTIEEVRDAVHAFVARYNAEWLIEENGHRSPAGMREAWQEVTFRRAA